MYRYLGDAKNGHTFQALGNSIRYVVYLYDTNQINHERVSVYNDTLYVTLNNQHDYTLIPGDDYYICMDRNYSSVRLIHESNQYVAKWYRQPYHTWTYKPSQECLKKLKITLPPIDTKCYSYIDDDYKPTHIQLGYVPHNTYIDINDADDDVPSDYE